MSGLLRFDIYWSNLNNLKSGENSKKWIDLKSGQESSVMPGLLRRRRRHYWSTIGPRSSPLYLLWFCIKYFSQETIVSNISRYLEYHLFCICFWFQSVVQCKGKNNLLISLQCYNACFFFLNFSTPLAKLMSLLHYRKKYWSHMLCNTVLPLKDTARHLCLGFWSICAWEEEATTCPPK